MSAENHSKRPLSPHLMAYKPQMTSVLSILHRATGVALAIGTLMVVCILTAAALGEKDFNMVMEFWRSPIGMLLTFGWSVALFYHLSNGVRHLIWDTGRLFKLQNAMTAGYFVLASTVILTALAWLL